MAKTDKTTDPLNAFPAFIMPRTQHRWLLNSIGNLTPEESELLKIQLTACHFEYNPETLFNSRYGQQESHSLLLVIEDPVLNDRHPEMESIIQKLCDAKTPFDIIIDTPGWTKDNIQLIERRATYQGCTVSKYTYNLDYANSETCKYPIKFSVKKVLYSSPDKDKYFNPKK